MSCSACSLSSMKVLTPQQCGTEVRGPVYENAQMRRAMIKMVTTRASLGLSCNATSISSTSTAPVRLADTQIVLADEGNRPLSYSACRGEAPKKSNQICAYLVCGRKSVYASFWALLARPDARSAEWRLVMLERGERQTHQETPATTRRTILRAAGLLGLTGAGAAALGACAEESSGSPSVTPAAPETSAAASPSPAADATSPNRQRRRQRRPAVLASRHPKCRSAAASSWRTLTMW
jgi:hypothetical protein